MWNVDSLKQHFDEKFADTDKALVKQAVEYERRLSDLNHAHERAAEVAHTNVSLDKFETARATDAVALKLALERVDQRAEGHELRLNALERFNSKVIGIGVVLVLFSGMVGAAIMRALGG